jgi:ribosome-associated protein
VQLRFNVLTSLSLTDWAREMLLRGGKLTKDGVLVITAQRFREQERNRADARERLVEIVRQAATPKTVRRETKVPRASKRKRLDGKKHRAEIKKGRSRPD